MKDHKVFAKLIAGCFFIWGILLFLTNWIFKDPNLFGDSAGAVNALFSAFAFAGIIYAIILQKEELSLQREELKQTREELINQKKEFQIQNDTLIRQRFDNTFFQMLSLQQEITDGLRYENAHDKIELGRGIFYALFEDIPMRKKDGSSLSCSAGLKGAIKKFGVKIYKDLLQPAHFDHYFRHLYRIIKFVHTNSFLKEEEKYQYISMLRATLSRYELLWLFYNCFSEYGKDKFKPLIEEYSLFKNLRKELLINSTDIAQYSDSAYGHTIAGTDKLSTLDEKTI